MADQDFDITGAIDILLGAEVYEEILLPGLIKADIDTPMAQHTILGWILSWKIGHYEFESPRKKGAVAQVNLEDKMKQFWEIEVVPRDTPRSV